MSIESSNNIIPDEKERTISTIRNKLEQINIPLHPEQLVKLRSLPEKDIQRIQLELMNLASNLVAITAWEKGSYQQILEGVTPP